MRRCVTISLLVFLPAGCGDDPERKARATASPTPAATATASATPSAERAGKEVTFRGDGRRVRGVLARESAKAPAVILLHQRGGDLSQWDELAPVLQRAGFTTLAYDDRGSLDETEMVGDLAAAVRYLRRDRPQLPVGVVGASNGASTAVYAGSHRLRRQLDAIVAMSPADSSPLIELQTSGAYRPHDMLLISDRSEGVTTENLLPGARRSKRLVAAENGHGVELVDDPEVREAIVRWLDDRLR